ncbi:FMN-binding negative transcriptional regulator [Acinetobacter qingfengensis]|uniref:Negative transcriptional regulator n=1 Tax=Acinetobacter qingfengensis TaxID=1262585 RepID=A0A1E7RCA5_9GAMM|nr:FMN-binding negative transcriptional regulator [Acinetobacter qingfengensis]KAA8734840.1 FMN-binding negative transcriptional regulator [Acinetobacter qingfengensis]OEY96882.1 negative transcriptional regulator [Acinetobacter qingfengensis]
MYIPAHFAETDLNTLHQLIMSHPFGVLITHGSQGLDANHLPFELHCDEGDFGTLHGHVARNNPVWQALNHGDEVLIIFTAGDAYISPQWYPSKQKSHQQVPSWNYMVAHAYGKITIHDDERYVRGVVARLTRTHEASQPVAWKMTDAPKDYIDSMLKLIVGIEIEITRIEGKSKLSQNKEHRDIAGAAHALNASGHRVIAQAMQVIPDKNT